MRKYTPKPSAKVFIQILIFIVAVLITVLAAAYLSSYRILMTALIVLFWLAAIIFGGILLPMYFRRTVMYISPTEISVHSGFFFIWREHMKVESMQYFSYIKTPLSKFTGFNFISVHALGASLLLPFLSQKDAEDIATQLSEKIESK